MGGGAGPGGRLGPSQQAGPRTAAVATTAAAAAKAQGHATAVSSTTPTSAAVTPATVRPKAPSLVTEPAAAVVSPHPGGHTSGGGSCGSWWGTAVDVLLYVAVAVGLLGMLLAGVSALMAQHGLAGGGAGGGAGQGGVEVAAAAGMAGSGGVGAAS